MKTNKIIEKMMSESNSNLVNGIIVKKVRKSSEFDLEAYKQRQKKILQEIFQ